MRVARGTIHDSNSRRETSAFGLCLLFGNSTSPLFPAVVGCALPSDAAVRTARKTTLQSQNMVYVRFDGHRSGTIEHVHTAQRFRYIYNEH